MRANVLFYQGNSSLSQAREALVAVAVESALLAAGDGIHKKVSDLLMDKYNCKIMDCNKHPEYLNASLSDLEEDTRSKLINAVRKELDEYSNIKTISSFLNALEN
ncbi:MAG: hypothetical protein KGH88_01325 [Thaumarchaeota archaeon]|nr:hypothetical protein [Nitrososphaerota archaeon]